MNIEVMDVQLAIEWIDIHQEELEEMEVRELILEG